MPIIPKVGRESFKTGVLDFLIHCVLLAGAFSIVYPFLIMLSGSVKSDLDMKTLDILPAFLYNDATLFKKHIQTKYNDSLDLAVSNFKSPLPNFGALNPPDPFSRSVCADFESFVSSPSVDGDPKLFGLGMVWEHGVEPYMLREFKRWLKSVYGKGPEGVRKLNADCGTQFTDWDEIMIPPENYLPRRVSVPNAGYLEKMLEFKMLHSATWQRYYFDIDGAFAAYLRKTVARSLAGINAALGTEYRNWSQVCISQRPPKKSPALAKAWEDFVREELNPDFITVDSGAAQDFRVFLKKKYRGGISTLNKTYGTDYGSFEDVDLPQRSPPAGAERGDWSEFITLSAPLKSLSLKGLTFEYREHLASRFKRIDEANAIFQLGYEGFSKVKMPEALPEGNVALQRDWKDFIRSMRESGIGLKRSSMFEYKDFIAEKYEDKDKSTDFSKMSVDYRRHIIDHSDIPYYFAYPGADTEKSREHYGEAVRSNRFEGMVVLRDVSDFEKDWTFFLQQRYGSIEKLNKEYGLLIDSFDTAPLPTLQWEWSKFQESKSKVKAEFLWRNYAMVIDTVVYNGRAALNTLIYCTLSILAALLVNPMAAYALSRFRPPSTYKILLLMMLTIGFPSIVIGIPNFLMLKSMGLMNTYAALILPGMASGFSIFLLKGFFDSLPKELFECATLDGASERVIFWHVAMSLSKPILAVTALQTFITAYGDFMMAFLVCQNPKMWTMMVYLYQLQQRSSPSVAFAALVVSAIPTFLIYVLCQNLILRGIVVPSEK